MHDNYLDITSRIKQAPKWYDQNGTPRYAKFNPRLCPDIYAHTVILLEIACQHCGKKFKVEMHADYLGSIRNPKNLHYGDPPNHRCPGDSMNCEDLQVLEVWRKDWKTVPVRFKGKIVKTQDLVWRRVKRAEGKIK